MPNFGPGSLGSIPIRDIADEKIIHLLLLSSADNICKQFGPTSGRTERQSSSGYKLFDTLTVFLKDFFEKVNFEKSQQTTTKA